MRISKNCLKCGKSLERGTYEGRTGETLIQFIKRQFCSLNCRRLYRGDAPYKLADTEHNRLVKCLKVLLKSDIVYHSGEGYFPDLRGEKISYELEMLGRKRELKRKSIRWGNSESHALIIAIPIETQKLFDKIYFYNKNTGLIVVKK